MLSRTLSGVFPGRKKRLIIIASRRKIAPRVMVALLRKSAVLLIPNTVPKPAPPNAPASPPPLQA